MKTIDKSLWLRLIGLVMISSIIMFSYYVYRRYIIYNSIGVVLKDSIMVEYGSDDYDIKKLLDVVSGKVVSVERDIDTMVVGKQEVILKLEKSNVVREVPIMVEVIDTVKPVINLKYDQVNVDFGEKIDLFENILEVRDEVDGEIDFLPVENDKKNNYYNFEYSGDISSVGEHEIIVHAYDKSGNETMKSFNLKVNEKIKNKIVPVIYKKVQNNLSSHDIVSIATSLIGSSYVASGTGPDGFDCSGFVQYVYSKVGKKVSRSTSTQLYDGIGILYQDAQPGDILSWGYKDGISTHSALYIGNGQMIHATNPKQGVIKSDVAAWARGSGTRVISVRRIN